MKKRNPAKYRTKLKPPAEFALLVVSNIPRRGIFFFFSREDFSFCWASTTSSSSYLLSHPLTDVSLCYYAMRWWWNWRNCVILRRRRRLVWVPQYGNKRIRQCNWVDITRPGAGGGTTNPTYWVCWWYSFRSKAIADNFLESCPAQQTLSILCTSRNK